jgi:hypothetical protein
MKKEDFTEEEIDAMNKSLFLAIKEGFFKRNWFNVLFLVLISIAMIGISSELIDLAAKGVFSPFNAFLIILCFLYTFITIFLIEIANKEIDRYCDLLAQEYLLETHERIQERLKEAEVVNTKLEKEEEEDK